MEVGTEISQKIRSAIKAKLIELGAYVDDELPDYIMVMVANKKSREQMISDLSLFLGKHTDAFAEWLHGLLGKLQTISVDSSGSKAGISKEKKKSDSRKEKKVKKASRKGADSQGKKVKSVSGSSKKKVSTDDKTALSKGNSESSDKPKNSNSTEQRDVQVQNEGEAEGTEIDGQGQSATDSVEVEDVRQMLVTVAPTDELAAELETTEDRIEQAQVGKPSIPVVEERMADHAAVRRKRSASPRNERRVQSSIAPKKHKGLTSVVASISKDVEEEEYDPLCPAVGSVASVVKVTSRKSRVPPALQANRALLVKAMGEAEQSIAIKRRVVAPNNADREDSPSDVYTPKRKKSSSGVEPSPPPYIPSRKESSLTSSRTSTSSSRSSREVDRHGHITDRRSDYARTTLSSRDRHDLISRSRRMELFKHIGIDRKEEPVGTNRVRRASHESRRKMESVRRESVQRVNRLGSTREVSKGNVDEGVKDLKIKARLGPVRTTLMTATESNKLDGKESGRSELLDLREKMSRSTYSKDILQIVVNPTASPALKGSVISRLGKIVIKRNAGSMSASDGDDNDDERMLKISEKSERVEKGRMAVSRHAKSLVNRQCREAVLSVSSSRKLEFTRSGKRVEGNVSPDSRHVEADDDDDDNDDEEEEEEGGDEIIGETRIVPSVNENVKEKRATLKLSEIDNVFVGDDDEEDDDDGAIRKAGDRGDNDPEDLADMIGENLEPELLDDTIQDDLDLETENREDSDDIETMIGVKSEDKPKAGTRFIVTLDGIDERQFDAENDGSSNSKGGVAAGISSIFIKQQPMLGAAMPKLSPPTPFGIQSIPHLSPQLAPPVGVIPVQANTIISPIVAPMPPDGHPSPIFNISGDPSHPLPPPLMSVVPREPVKPLPPKIQPFSINLKDSDDEFEDKESRLHQQNSRSTVSGGNSYINQPQPSASDTLTTLTALQKAKMSERCKFWPACAAGSECEFHHPTSYCKTFPNCKFADKCLFIHPNCRFDSKCTRQDCPFTHTSRRPILTSSIPSHHQHPATISKPLPPPPPAPVTLCRFIPNCQNPGCPFLHPKPCRFGTTCQNVSCPFYHPTVPVLPSISKLKWKATPTQPKEVTPPLTSSSVNLPASDPTSKFRQPVAKVSPMSSTSSN